MDLKKLSLASLTALAALFTPHIHAESKLDLFHEAEVDGQPMKTFSDAAIMLPVTGVPELDAELWDMRTAFGPLYKNDRHSDVYYKAANWIIDPKRDIETTALISEGAYRLYAQALVDYREYSTEYRKCIVDQTGCDHAAKLKSIFNRRIMDLDPTLPDAPSDDEIIAAFVSVRYRPAVELMIPIAAEFNDGLNTILRLYKEAVAPYISDFRVEPLPLVGHGSLGTALILTQPGVVIDPRLNETYSVATTGRRGEMRVTFPVAMISLIMALNDYDQEAIWRPQFSIASSVPWTSGVGVLEASHDYFFVLQQDDPERLPEFKAVHVSSCALCVPAQFTHGVHKKL